jgi:hypothetical protein
VTVPSLYPWQVGRETVPGTCIPTRSAPPASPPPRTLRARVWAEAQRQRWPLARIPTLLPKGGWIEFDGDFYWRMMLGVASESVLKQLEAYLKEREQDSRGD